MNSFVEEELNIDRLPLLESLMSLGNGYMGSRSYLEEFEYKGSIRGNYINGIYETIPMKHAEWAWGFPLLSDRMPNLLDLFKITIKLDNEEVVINGSIEDFKRELDFKRGIYKRSYKYITENKKIAKIKFEELISFKYKELRTWTLDIEYDGLVEVENYIDLNIENMSDEKDPRTAPETIKLIEVTDVLYNLNIGNIWLETINSGIEINMGFKDEGVFESVNQLTDDYLNISFSSSNHFKLTRTVRYWDSIRNIKINFANKDLLYEEQEKYLKKYEKETKIHFLDNKEINKTINLLKFHLLQSTTRDRYGNISAKGLSGEGYEGHYFWDTEIFLFPVWILWDSSRARDLLLYRYNLLNYARSRAIEMGHQKGACFSWRTISGRESSGYFPAGSAQFHINFDIAYTFIQWWLSNKDMEFLIKYSMELLIETARTALEIGSFEEDGFHIHTVTGPDEYTALVSNNYYTNRMAQYNLKWTIKLWDKLREERYEDFLVLKEKLNVKESEIEKMRLAQEKMVFIIDEEKEIIAQDSSFLSKAKWPKENDLRPLLLNYHPLTIYRHQVIKQADVILALYLLGEVDEEIIKNSFYYYESINTHDSSLSQCISGLMAVKVEDHKLSYDSFLKSLYLDINNTNKNTNHGMHMANIGGVITTVLGGFAGIRIQEDGLHIEPHIPKKLGRIVVRFTWRETLLEVNVDNGSFDVKRISGPSVKLKVNGKDLRLGKKAVLFDLDGVLTSTSDNHYEAWRKLTKELGYDLPIDFRDMLRGVSRIESLEAILNHYNLNFSAEEKIELTNKKNKYYKESIYQFTSENLNEGAEELLKKLKSKDVEIALVSASKNAPDLIRKLGIQKYFDGVVDPKSLARGKPYPDPFLKAAEILNVEPKDCIGIEDAEVGIESIKGAGIFAVGIGDEDLKKADVKFSSIKEASKFIIKWVGKDYGRD